MDPDEDACGRPNHILNKNLLLHIFCQITHRKRLKLKLFCGLLLAFRAFRRLNCDSGAKLLPALVPILPALLPFRPG